CAGERRTGGPVRRMGLAALAPAFDRSMIPSPDPVKLAMEEIAGVKAERNGGLWLGGDIREGLTRLQWIAGQKNADLLSVAGDGKVTMSHDLLMHRSVGDCAGAGARRGLAVCINAQDGLDFLRPLL